MGAVLDVRLNIPKSDMKFLKEFVTKMGWIIETKENKEDFEDILLADNSYQEYLNSGNYSKPIDELYNEFGIK